MQAVVNSSRLWTSPSRCWMSTWTLAIVGIDRGELVEVQLELLAPVAVPAIMPLSWDFIVHQFALFGSAYLCYPGQRRNRQLRVRSGGVDPRWHEV